MMTVDLGHVAMAMKENETDEAVKNKEDFSFWKEESKEEEGWEQQKEECTIEKGESHLVSSIQLAGYKHSAINLAMASDASF